MTKLRADFLAYLQLKGYAEAIIRNYIQSVALLARYHNKSPLELTQDDIITYLLYIHCIIPAGGLSRSGKNWISCKNSFLFPFGPMKKLFLSKVLDYFRRGLADGSISLTGHLTKYKNDSELNKLYNMLIFKSSQRLFQPSPVLINTHSLVRTKIENPCLAQLCSTGPFRSEGGVVLVWG